MKLKKEKNQNLSKKAHLNKVKEIIFKQIKTFFIEV